MDVRSIAESILAEMGNDPMAICNGGCRDNNGNMVDCTDFAKRLISQVGSGVIVDALSTEMKREIKGFKTQPAKYNPNKLSHCYVLIDGAFYDAFNPEGVSEESELEFHDKL